jgi:hypothetical protein
MWLNELRQRWLGRGWGVRKNQRRPRRTKIRLTLEALEGRCVPSTLTVTSSGVLTAHHKPSFLRLDVTALGRHFNR